MGIVRRMSAIAIVLLAAAIVIVAASEWPRLSARIGGDERRLRQRKRRRAKSNLRVVHPDHEEFARSVERDLAALPTIDEQDAKRR
jgi:lauroyl/myristoyl acyltransferase